MAQARKALVSEILCPLHKVQSSIMNFAVVHGIRSVKLYLYLSCCPEEEHEVEIG